MLFQASCPNRRVLTIRELEDLDNMEIEGDEEQSGEEGETCDLPPKEGKMLMIKRVHHATKASSESNQREQVFHSRCKVLDKTCSLSIDGGSCTNSASTEMVSRLNLDTMTYLRPYTPQWLEKGNEVAVFKQTLAPFSISEYRDEVLFDVLPMDACHFVLKPVFHLSPSLILV